MINTFMNDEEYRSCFREFWGLRKQIAELLVKYDLQSAEKVLDILAGHGYFSFEIQQLIKKGIIDSIGLENDYDSYAQALEKKVKENSFITESTIVYHIMNVIDLNFPDSYFDFIVNFLGLEDLQMTHGICGVRQCFNEMGRVLKQNGILLITICLEGDEPDQVLAKEITRAIGHQAYFQNLEFYVSEFNRINCEVLDQKWFYTNRKMTVNQSREEIRFACEETSKIFKQYNVHTIPFTTLWNKYQEKLSQHGMAYYSRLCVLIGKKL